jgi:hypothetical protein
MKCSQSTIKCAFVNDKLIFIQEYTKPDIVKCKNNHLLCGVQGAIKDWHFRHICSEDICSPVSEWHLEWQLKFVNTEVRFNKVLDQIENRRADIVEGDYVVEVQHSSISKDEVDHRNKDYSLHGKEVIWVIDATKCSVNDKILIFDTKWKCESFLSCNFIYININDLIYKVSPTSIKSLTVRICPILKSEFIKSIKTNTVGDLPTEHFQSKLYVKQQGAGNGKTWGIIHMLARPDFQHYTQFIYVTKQHSARIIIKEEFRNQQHELGFTNISDIQELNKKFIIHYTNPKGQNCSLVIATIDSFMYAVGNKEVVAFDLFQGITDSIVNGHLDLKDNRGTINYAGLQPKLNSETLYIVDETQDLNSNYASAILKIMEKTNIDVYIVGDKLQSISNEINAFGTFRKANHILEGDENVCRRFIHPHLVSFVNHMIPFNKHELPEVTPYISCDLSEDVVFPILMNTNPYIKEDELEDGVLKLMHEYNKEVNLHNYYPEHFLIVTPFVKNNPFVDTLSLAINNFWIEKFKDETYKSTISDPFWKKHEKEYYKYSIFHKSETGTSINLDESARSTRIVSIHASKGDGRECVFVIGVTEHNLKRFSGIKDTLRYDSLLHVAITRMKKSLYICHENDEIGRNITSWLTKMNKTFEVNQIRISERISVKNIVELCGDEFNSLIDLNYTDQSDETRIIDMSHHNIRGYILHERVSELLQNEMSDLKKQQINTINKRVCKSLIKDCNEWNGPTGYNNFVSLVKGKLNKSGEWIQEDFIPLLRINEGIYLKYYGIIRQVIERVKLNWVSTHTLCPLELIVFHYMKQIRRRGLKTPITMIDLYNIIDIYENAYKHHHLGHDHCCCKSIFKHKENKNDLSDYLQFHYEKMKKIDKVVKTLISKHPHTEWNTDHNLVYADNRFVLQSNASYIGYNKTEVVLCYLTPNLNTLNFNLYKTLAMVDVFLIKNQEKLNHEKYTMKKIVVYILSTNMTEPYELKIELDDSLIKPIIKRAMCEHYKTLNKEMYYFYLYAKTKYENFVKTFITDWMTLTNTTCSECPSYINDFMSGLNKDKRGKNVKVFLKELDETFLQKLNHELEMSVSDFLEIECS